ncbi:MAG TPA: hypothetical protein GXX55_04190 [Firmicutes bacterium]|nr:hypothetical protein [Bacillota bacterium]
MGPGLRARRLSLLPPGVIASLYLLVLAASASRFFLLSLCLGPGTVLAATAGAVDGRARTNAPPPGSPVDPGPKQGSWLLAQALGAEVNLPVSYSESVVQFLTGRSVVTTRTVWQLPPLYRAEQDGELKLTVVETPGGASAWVEGSRFVFSLEAASLPLRLRLLEVGGAPVPYLLLSEAVSAAGEGAGVVVRPASLGDRPVAVVVAPGRNDARFEFWIDEVNYFTWKVLQYDRDGALVVLVVRSGVSLPPRGVPDLSTPATWGHGQVLSSLGQWRQVVLGERLLRELGSGEALVPWDLPPTLRWIAAETVSAGSSKVVVLRLVTPKGLVSIYEERMASRELSPSPPGSLLHWPGSGSPVVAPGWASPRVPVGLPEPGGIVWPLWSIWGAGQALQVERNGFRITGVGPLSDAVFQQIVASLRPLTQALVTPGSKGR